MGHGNNGVMWRILPIIQRQGIRAELKTTDQYRFKKGVINNGPSDDGPLTTSMTEVVIRRKSGEAERVGSVGKLHARQTTCCEDGWLGMAEWGD